MRKLLSKDEINKIIKDKPPGVEVNDLLTNLLSKGYSLDGFEVMVVESKGLQGPKGPVGLPGPKGDMGIEGLPGSTGDRGPAGLDGKHGKDGRDGRDGRDGVDGRDGSPDTGEEIVKKINENSDQIDASKIKNLPHPQVIYQGGGGFPETQIKAGTNVTVTKDASGSWVIGSSSSGGGGHTIQDEGISLTQRTKLNFVGAGVTVTDDSGNDASVVTISTSAGAGYQAASSGTVNGTNTAFTFAVAPNAIVVDGVSLRKVATDTTVNWTGTTSITLAVAPNFDIYGVA